MHANDRLRTLRRASMAGLSALFLLGTFLRPLVLLPQSRATVSTPSSGEEFVGPFSSWTNVKTAYRAVGDGTADDTGALQNALNDVGRSGRSPVLFIPSGRYR